MVAEEIKNKPTLKAKFLWLGISYIVFLIVYNLSGRYASNLTEVRSFVFQFEYHIPFLSWMIIPYMTSGLLFIVIFFLCSYREEFILLVKRINFITIVSGICFLVYPLRFSFVKPEVDSSFLHFFYQFLNVWDTNYNQAPSLHISYACVFWSVLRQELRGKWKGIAGIWLVIMGISTLTIYQHHLIDIIAALLLVCVTFIIFPGNRNYHKPDGTVKKCIYRIIFIKFGLKKNKNENRNICKSR
jgi:membrane-associated phospholipid phosphatase